MVRAREVDAQQTWGCWRRPPSTAGAASSPPPSAHETPPPWPPRLCDRRQPFRQRGIFCYRLFGRRSHSSQFGSELSIAFREVGPLPFSIVLMRLGVRPLLDGQPEEAFQLGPKGRESEVYLARFCCFRCYARFGLSQSLSRGRCVLFHGRLLGPLRLEDAEQFGRVDSEASIVGPPRRKPAFPDGAPDVDFARSGLFRRLLKAQRAHCVPSRATNAGDEDGKWRLTKLYRCAASSSTSLRMTLL